MVKIELEPADGRYSERNDQVSVSTRFVSLNGTIIVGRDIARQAERTSDRGEDLPQYIKDHVPIYAAGPCQETRVRGLRLHGPTTAGRMDPCM